MSKPFKILRDLMVRGRYEKILSNSISELIIKNISKKNIKILDYGSGVEPTVLRMVRNELSKNSMKAISHGYDLYDDIQLEQLNNKEGDETYFNVKNLVSNNEIYDVAVISDVLHHVGINKTEFIKDILLSIKKRSKFLIIKDHFQYGYISNQMIRLMDFFGNLNSNIKTPKKYYSIKEFDILINSLNFSIKSKILNNRYHPKIFFLFNNPKYHFIYLLE